MERKTIIKKMGRNESSKFDMVRRYYTILSIMDDWGLTEREIQLLAFTATKGNITYSDIKEEFCNIFKSSNATINNIVSKLSKKHLFVKTGDRVKVNPHLLFDLENNMAILINLNHA